jgi:hypothetical protein
MEYEETVAVVRQASAGIGSEAATVTAAAAGMIDVGGDLTASRLARLRLDRIDRIDLYQLHRNFSEDQLRRRSG